MKKITERGKIESIIRLYFAENNKALIAEQITVFFLQKLVLSFNEKYISIKLNRKHKLSTFTVVTKLYKIGKLDNKTIKNMKLESFHFFNCFNLYKINNDNMKKKNDTNFPINKIICGFVKKVDFTKSNAFG